MPSETARNARLDELQAAITAWANKKRDYLNNQLTFAKRVLAGRPGLDRLQNGSVKKATSFLADEIDQFLSG